MKILDDKNINIERNEQEHTIPDAVAFNKVRDVLMATGEVDFVRDELIAIYNISGIEDCCSKTERETAKAAVNHNEISEKYGIGWIIDGVTKIEAWCQQIDKNHKEAVNLEVGKEIAINYCHEQGGILRRAAENEWVLEEHSGSRIDEVGTFNKENLPEAIKEALRWT